MDDCVISDATVTKGCVEEIWKVVPDYEKYEVSNLGRIRSWFKPTPFYLSPTVTSQVSEVTGKTRYSWHVVTLSNSKGSHGFTVSTLVLLVFVGPKPKGKIIRHLDSDSFNNNLDNLVYGTSQENSDDRAKARGYSYKVKKEDISKIRLRLEAGESCASIARELKVCSRTISRIKQNKAVHYSPQRMSEEFSIGAGI
jgi:hypothetical protein